MVWVEGENEENGSAVLENSGGSSKRKTEGTIRLSNPTSGYQPPKIQKQDSVVCIHSSVTHNGQNDVTYVSISGWMYKPKVVTQAVEHHLLQKGHRHLLQHHES